LWTDCCVFSCPRLALALWPMCFVYIPFLRQWMIAAALFHSFLTKAMKACCEWTVWLTNLQWAQWTKVQAVFRSVYCSRGSTSDFFHLVTSCFLDG
jgi:hypothetical protein